MPQNRRKVPFSGKQKKQQLLEKKQKNRNFSITNPENESDDGEEKPEAGSLLESVQKINVQPNSRSNRNNRYALQFHKESKEQLRQMQEDARNAIKSLSEQELEVADEYFDGYDFPVRPKWTYEMSKEVVDSNENRYFFNYVKSLEKRHHEEGRELSYCELNLETWRQLWRVLEISDLILFIVDVRMASLMFPPSIYDYVNNTLGKHLILVLNKIDLVRPTVVLAWKNYFSQKYPDISIILFTSYPSNNSPEELGLASLRAKRRRGRMRMAVEGAKQILGACKSIVGSDIDFSSWETKIKNEVSEVTEEDDDDEKVETEGTHEPESLFPFEEHEKYKNGILTIGCVGFPNVGKSSVLNALMGKKVVSVSQTPGHTKHFQTIFLTNNIRLCDCPGLVFPSSTPRNIQVLLGSYPIAQLKVPYASVKFLAERIDLPKLLNVKHPEGDDEEEWSAMDICTAWALKRGFLTAKAARPDTYRAANNILRMALSGKLVLALKPFGYGKELEKLSQSRELEEIRKIQCLGKSEEETLEEFEEEETESDENCSDEEEKTETDTKGEKSKKEVPLTYSNAFDLLNEGSNDDS